MNSGKFLKTCKCQSCNHFVSHIAHRIDRQSHNSGMLHDYSMSRDVWVIWLIWFWGEKKYLLGLPLIQCFETFYGSWPWCWWFLGCVFACCPPACHAWCCACTSSCFCFCGSLCFCSWRWYRCFGRSRHWWCWLEMLQSAVVMSILHYSRNNVEIAFQTLWSFLT